MYKNPAWDYKSLIKELFIKIHVTMLFSFLNMNKFATWVYISDYHWDNGVKKICQKLGARIKYQKRKWPWRGFVYRMRIFEVNFSKNITMPYVSPNKVGLFEGSFFWVSIWALSYKFLSNFYWSQYLPPWLGGFSDWQGVSYWKMHFSN